MWLTDFTPNGWITFDMGAPRVLNGFHLWNYNEPGGFLNRGAQSGMLSVSVDGVNYSTPQPYTFAKASAS